MPHRLLLLCTGNYYRSRFAEEWFNHQAARRGLDWIADSAGLAERCWMQNSGPISAHTLSALRALGVAVRGAHRSPQDVHHGLFDVASRVIALYRKEHEPMLRQRFPQLIYRVEYWDHADVDELSPEECLPRLRARVDELVDELSLFSR